MLNHFYHNVRVSYSMKFINLVLESVSSLIEINFELKIVGKTFEKLKSIYFRMKTNL